TEYLSREEEFKNFESEIRSQIQNLKPIERISYLNKISQEFGRRIALPCPDVLVAICPYCSRKIWARIRNGLFTLCASFWILESDDGKWVTEDSKCQHFFLLDGALHLNSKPIPEKLTAYGFVRNKIYMGAEVPFIKPRILKKEGVIAVIHSIAIGNGYTGYPITYFTKEKISQSEFAMGWAREEYSAKDELVSNATFTGVRFEPQDYDLEKWIQLDKIKWIISQKEDFCLNNPKDFFPYLNLEGRKNPYTIQNGRILDLPNSTQIEGSANLETFMPGQ
ncbi:MAG TPA: hypothetical protein PKX55_18170, partial [Leptospiraceae bacterium]|nr:hypothetical protein [Leptospiraceae bacterium]